ncbi:VOC family protein [Gordonia sp. OPL2]|uniref:VOC family protein n=1 Tax=Gordonia sp. OPL2 TaxID=2486274 RepID=UPI001654DBD1|nr:VOC family protein [Gordonia sp. OPL2]ROZ99374.1 VOC family protein [Gordonia sp. OPL2]
MSSDLVCTVVNSRDPERLAAFWCRALEVEVTTRWSDDRGTAFIEISRDGRCILLFQSADEATPDIAHLHLDLRPSGSTQSEEVRRLVGEGAVVVSDDTDLPWVVLADPDGNPFCVLPREPSG